MADVTITLRAILEESERLLLGGEPWSLAKLKRSRDPIEADTVLSKAEELLFASSRTPSGVWEAHGDESSTCSFDVHIIARDACLLRCQIAGCESNYEKIIAAADRAIHSIVTIRTMSAAALNLKAASPDESWEEAWALGYKGFALVGTGRHREALPILERSAALCRDSSSAAGAASPRGRGSASATMDGGVTLAEKRRRRESAAVSDALRACYKASGAAPPLPRLLKYPRTAHLFDAGGTSTTDDDVVLSMDDAMLRSLGDGRTAVIVEEKVDGANMGFSLCPMSGEVLVQNRSHYISCGDHKQFSQVKPWVETHRCELVRILSGGCAKQLRPSLVLYGEWVAARHSIPYGRLPGYFIAFDLLDAGRNKFVSRRRFHQALAGSGIPVVPTIARARTFGPFVHARSRAAKDSTSRALVEARKAILPLLETASAFRSDGGTVEGIVLRIDDEDSEDSGWLAHRCKIVRPDFIRGCGDGHWSTRPVEKQTINFDFAELYLSECCVFFAPSAGSPPGAAIEKSRIIEDGGSNGGESSAGAPETAEKSTETDYVPAAKKAASTSKREIRARKEREAQLSRARRRAPRCVVLCGLPGAGKSTFAERLRAGFTPREEGKNGGQGGGQGGCGCYAVVNQDKMGRKECVAVAGRASRGKGRVVVDRCNPTASEREEWARIMHSPPRGESALVHFATSEETCVERVKSRVGHETIPEGRGEGIVRGVAKSFEEPTEEERRNKYGSVYVVRNFEDANALLRRWGVMLGHDRGDDSGDGSGDTA